MRRRGGGLSRTPPTSRPFREERPARSRRPKSDQRSRYRGPRQRRLPRRHHAVPALTTQTSTRASPTTRPRSPSGRAGPLPGKPGRQPREAHGQERRDGHPDERERPRGRRGARHRDRDRGGRRHHPPDGRQRPDRRPLVHRPQQVRRHPADCRPHGLCIRRRSGPRPTAGCSGTPTTAKASCASVARWATCGCSTTTPTGPGRSAATSTSTTPTRRLPAARSQQAEPHDGDRAR